MARSAYKAKIAVSFILDDEATQISSNMVKYIMIEDMYQSRYMPVIYISMAVTNKVYKNIIENEKKAKMYLDIRLYNAYSNTSLEKDSIKGKFTYIVSSSNPNYGQELVDSTQNTDSAYRTVTVALINMDLLNKSKTSFNGVFGNIDQATLIYKIMEGRKSVIKAPLYNPVYETIMIPPLNSRTKLLEYLFLKCPFYDTKYMFFMDFDRSYLLDLTGTGLDANDGDMKSVFIDIRSVTVPEAYYEGVEIQDNAYYMYINPANTNVTENKATDKISNQLVFVNDAGTVDAVNLNVNNNYDSDVKQSFKRGGNAVLYKNIAESNTVTIEVEKENIDGSLFTPNKEYFIKNYEGFNDYNGRYSLLYKKEVIKNTGSEFGVSVCLGLRKVGNITSIGAHVATLATNNSRSATYRYTPSSTKTTTTTATTSTTTLSAANPTVKVKALPPVIRISALEGQSLKRSIDNIVEEDE